MNEEKSKFYTKGEFEIDGDRITVKTDRDGVMDVDSMIFAITLRNEGRIVTLCSPPSEALARNFLALNHRYPFLIHDLMEMLMKAVDLVEKGMHKKHQKGYTGEGVYI